MRYPIRVALMMIVLYIKLAYVYLGITLSSNEFVTIVSVPAATTVLNKN